VQKAAVAGRCSQGVAMVKMVSMVDNYKEITGERLTLRPEELRVQQLHWSNDGQLLTVGMERGGALHCYLTKLSALATACETRIVYLSSLREMTIIDGVNQELPKIVLSTDVEPAFVALGPKHCAVGMNNRVWFYSCVTPGSCELVNEQEYVGSVEVVSLNATHASVLIEGRVYLHSIEPKGPGVAPETMIFPEKEDERSISCATIAGIFLIYAHSNGHLQYYSLADGTEVNEFRHTAGLRAIYPNHAGTRVVMVDQIGGAYLYNPVNDDCLAVPDVPGSIEKVVWDAADATVFVISDGTSLFPYVYTQVAVGGSMVRRLGNLSLGTNGELLIDPVATPIPHGHSIVMLYDGSICTQTPSGVISTQGARLKSHDNLLRVPGDPADREQQCFLQNLSLNRFVAAFKVAVALDSKEVWMALGRRALECLDIASAMKAYRQVPSPGMVQFLERASLIEDRQLLSGHIALVFGLFKDAQSLFLSSCQPEAALDMNCDLMQWDQALHLARSFAPNRLPDILLKSAVQLEAKGEKHVALQHYEQALLPEANDKEAQTHNNLCQAGIARSAIQLGDLARGVTIAKQLRDERLCKDCAASLESMKQFTEAAELYEMAGLFEKAAALHIQDLNFEAAAPLMKKVSTPKLHQQYAKAKEGRGAYREAMQAYEAARDGDNVVRILLDHLNEPQRAFQIVRETQSVSGALLVAKYCEKQRNIRAGIEFLFLANQDDEAFKMACQHDEMEVYEKVLGDTEDKKRHIQIAEHYEKKNMLAKAAKHYGICDEYSTALKLYLKCGERELDAAIDLVAKSRNATLIDQLVDFIRGDSDNVPKDKHFEYKLQYALGNFLHAVGIALMIAQREEEAGNYKAAHALLLKTYRDLESQKLGVPMDLWRQLMILHSYILVKRLVKNGDHTNAALMLLRVAQNIQRFPAHMVPILTSVVIECQRAGIKDQAREYACVLMRPENRSLIAEQYKRKIESIVRKGAASQAEPFSENTAPCAYCGMDSLAESTLECPQCQNISPFCVATGLRVLRNDWAACPSCHFPARYSAFQACAQAEGACPMCSAPLKPGEVQMVSDVTQALETAKQLLAPPMRDV